MRLHIFHRQPESNQCRFVSKFYFSSINSPDKRRSVDNHHQQQIQSVNKNNINEIDSYDPNQNRCNVNKKPTNYLYAGNNNSVIREQFQHPVLTALINESQCQMRGKLNFHYSFLFFAIYTFNTIELMILFDSSYLLRLV